VDTTSGKMPTVPFIVRRDQIPIAAESVGVNVEARHFSDHRYLRGATAATSTVLTWIRVAAGTEAALGPRSAPSMLVVFRGSAVLAGRDAQQLEKGDIVILVKGCEHRLTAATTDELEAALVTLRASGGEGLPVEAPRVIRKRAIPSIQTIDKGGVTRLLGEFRDFRWNAELRAVFSATADLSLSWAHLLHREQLDAHTHAIQSMMVIYEGEGRVFGDLRSPLRAGDVLVVPPGCVHGFEGGPAGLWAMTVQLDEGGFYTNPEKPRVTFVDESTTA
jgi:quercetin dioxygenase-like cupin family protein